MVYYNSSTVGQSNGYSAIPVGEETALFQAFHVNAWSLATKDTPPRIAFMVYGNDKSSAALPQSYQKRLMEKLAEEFRKLGYSVSVHQGEDDHVMLSIQPISPIEAHPDQESPDTEAAFGAFKTHYHQAIQALKDATVTRPLTEDLQREIDARRFEALEKRVTELEQQQNRFTSRVGDRSDRGNEGAVLF